MKLNSLPFTLVALALTAGSAHAAVITINNAGFEDASGTGGNGNLTTLADWTEEDPGNVYVDDNGTTWVPEVSRTLYFNGGSAAAVHQDLSHNWSSSDSFTIGLIAMNPTWATGTTQITVQLRQASDDAVLWDSGTADVTGAVVAGPAYSGTGHILSWNIDASTFTTGTAGEQINIRIANVAGFTYADNVSLDVTTIPEPSAVALLGLGGLALLRRRR